MDYVRGQETFVNRLVLLIANLFRLKLWSALIALLAATIVYFSCASEGFRRDLDASCRQLKNDFRSFKGFAKFKSLPGNVVKIGHRLFADKPGIERSTAVFFIVWPSLLVVLAVFFKIRGKKMMEVQHQRGGRLLTAKELKKQIKQATKNEVAEIRNDVKKDLGLVRGILQRRKIVRVADFEGKNMFRPSYQKVYIPKWLLYRHVALTGDTGAGKTTFLKHYLEHARKAGEQAIILDVNGELYAELGRKDDVILSLFDTRTGYWDLYKEMEHISPFEIATFMVSEDTGSAFWWKSGRVVANEILEINQSTVELWDWVRRKNSLKDIEGLAAKVIGEKGTPQQSGVIASTILELNFLRYLNFHPYWSAMVSQEQPPVDPFSVFEWTQNKQDKRWVFISISDTDKTISKILMKLLFNIAMQGIMSRNPDDPTNTPINVVIDEINTVGVLELLPNAIERLRKYAGKMLLGYQSNHQIYAMYGEQKGRAITSLLGSKAVFRTKDQKEAREMSDILGRQEYIKNATTESYGIHSMSDRGSLSQRESIKNVVLDTELQNLPDGHFYLKCVHLDPAKLRVKKKKWPKRFQLYNVARRHPSRDDLDKVDEWLLKLGLRKEPEEEEEEEEADENENTLLGINIFKV